MKFSNIFWEKVKERNVIGVRSVLLRQLNLDRTLSEPLVGAMADEALKNGIDLFKVDDGELFNLKQTVLTKDVWQDFRVKLEYNFSKEKFMMMQQIMSALREAKYPDFVAVQKTKTVSSNQGVKKGSATSKGSSCKPSTDPLRGSATTKGVSNMVKVVIAAVVIVILVIVAGAMNFMISTPHSV
ncbi:hypothetical protein C0Z01_04035 [Photobacterium kishitanii]|uniref:hypothetical protein n=1 Tax=Photobacterium kishitanii TaxID=318456 RepID=UPI00071AEC19|nr:hypothetical protein [Photobacterium kishitanii]OBU20520.1 hypothetical protein AYY22_09315 [Photobacterium kishitanii]PSU93748.1 hypothetical protein C0W35_11105 [Photobacterium kishitanii]PSW70815.1 hypothetical protein C0Z01_04035 [Photobacterium kishitanii]